MSWFKSQSRRLNGFSRLAPSDRVIAIKALALMPAISLALRFAGFVRVVRWLKLRHGESRLVNDRSAQLVRARHLSGIVEKIVRHGVGDRSCLRSSLALWYLLGVEGIAAEVRIGVKREPIAPFEAHAWVEVQGLPLNDAPDIGDRFKPFSDLSRALEAC